MPGNLVWEHSCCKAGSHSALVHKGIGFQIIPFATSGCFEALKGDVWHFWVQIMWEFWEIQEQGMTMSHQDSLPHLMCWSGEQIKEKTKVSQRARSSQNISLYGLEIVPGTANLIMQAQACPYSGLFITTFQFSRLRAGIWVIKEEVSNPPAKTKPKQNNPTNFQTSINEGPELTSMMMMMVFLDGTCCFLHPHAKLGFIICQFWSCISFYPGIKSFLLLHQPQLQCCLWVCVSGCASGVLFLSITFLVLGSWWFVFFPLPKKIVMHWFCYCHLPNTSDIMIKLLTSPPKRDHRIKRKRQRAQYKWWTKTQDYWAPNWR